MRTPSNENLARQVGVRTWSRVLGITCSERRVGRIDRRGRSLFQFAESP
jgi:hypothetical protein